MEISMDKILACGMGRILHNKAVELHDVCPRWAYLLPPST